MAKLSSLPTPEIRRPARERLLAAADELFYEGGIHTVGIDRVIERAGVAKASLYSAFGSKEALVDAYLAARQEARKARVVARIAQHESPRERVLAVFDALHDVMADSRFRGCAFNRAAAETKPGETVPTACQEARAWMRELFTSLAREAGVKSPEGFGRQLLLLYDGASVGGQMEGGSSAALAARSAAAALLDAAMSAPAKQPVKAAAAKAKRR